MFHFHRIGKWDNLYVRESSEYRIILHLRKDGDIGLGAGAMMRLHGQGQVHGAQGTLRRLLQLAGLARKQGHRQKKKADMPI